MKLFLNTLLFILSLAVMGCSEKGSHNPMLIRAEQLVRQSPDSAIQLLDSLHVTHRADSMYAALLNHEAILGVGLSYHQDTMLNTIMSYYHKSGKQECYARALLCRSLNAYRNGHPQAALRDVLRARDATDSRRVSGQAAFVLGQINLSAGYYYQAAENFRQALELTDGKDQETLRMLYRCKLAQAYEKCGRRDSFDHYVKKIGQPRSAPSPDVATEIAITLGDREMQAGHDKRAEAYLLQANRTDMTRRSSYLLGNIYARRGNLKAAEWQWYDAAQSSIYDVRQASLDSLMQLKPGNPFITDLYVRETRKLTGMAAGGEIAAIQAGHQQETAHRHAYRVMIISLSAIITLLVLLLVFLLYHRHMVRLFRRRMVSANRQYMHDLEAYTQARSDIAALKKRIEAYQEDHTPARQFDMEEMLLAETPVLALHAQASHGRTATDEQWAAVSQLLVERNDKLMAILSDNDGLSPREQHVCMLVRLRFIPSEMSALLSLTPQAITNLRVRLLQKLYGEKGGARDFDERIRARS